MIQIIIKNYKLLPENYSNKQNLIFNININLNNKSFSITDYYPLKEVERYYKDNYIINDYNENQLKLIKTISDFQINKLFIQINNELFASKFNQKYINIFNLNQEQGIKFEAHKYEVNNLIIDNNDHLISTGDKGSLKIWPSISSIESYYDINKNIEFELLPLMETKIESCLVKIIYIKENMIIGFNKESILIFQFDIENNKISIINSKNLILNNIIYIANKNIICASSSNKIMFIQIPKLEIVNELKISQKICNPVLIEQINDNEVIIGIWRSLKIINIDKAQIKIVKNLNDTFLCFKKLSDETMLVGLREEIRRFSLKNLKELPTLLKIKVTDYNYFDYEDYYGHDIQDNIINIHELKDGKIVVNFRFKIDIYEFTFI